MFAFLSLSGTWTVNTPWMIAVRPSAGSRCRSFNSWRYRWDARTNAKSTFLYKSCKRNVQAAWLFLFFFSCFHLHLCICHMLYHFFKSLVYTFLPRNYVTGNWVISVNFRGSSPEFVFTNMVNRCWNLVFQNSPVLFHIQNCTLSQLAWFSAHYMSHKLIEITEACNRKNDVKCGCERGGQNICLWWIPIREFPSTSLVPPAADSRQAPWAACRSHIRGVISNERADKEKGGHGKC